MRHKKPPEKPPLDVEKRLLKVDKVLGETVEKKVLETTVNLPVTAIKIFDVAARVINVQGEVREGGVLVTGVIKKQLYIVDKMDLVRHIPEEIPIKQFVQVEGARPGLNGQLRVSVIDVETQLINEGERVRQEILLEIFVKVTKKRQVEVVTGVKDGPKDLKVEKELLKVDSVIGETLVSEEINHTVELPITAKKIFQVVGEAVEVEADVREDAVEIRGMVHKQIFLVDEEDLVRHVEEDVPFKITVNLPGAKPDFHAQVDVEAIVDGFSLSDAPGRELEQTIVLDIFVKVTEMLQEEVVTEVEGTGIRVEKQLLKVDQVVADVSETEDVDSEFQLPMKAAKIFQILAEIMNVETEVVNGRVLVRAVLHKQVYYVDKRGLLRHAREDVPFQVVASVPGAEPGMKVQARLEIVGDVDFRLNENNLVEQTVEVKAFVKVTRTVQLKVVVDAFWKHIPEKLRFVMVKKGDTLYGIAQREGVSLEALIAANPQIKDPNLIFPGQKVFIPEKKPKPDPDPRPPTTRIYVIQKGDTLFKIAQRFGVSLDAIIKANPKIKDSDVIFPGQKIIIPQEK